MTSICKQPKQPSENQWFRGLDRSDPHIFKVPPTLIILHVVVVASQPLHDFHYVWNTYPDDHC